MDQAKRSKLAGFGSLLYANILSGLIPIVAVLSGAEFNPLLFIILWSAANVAINVIYLYSQKSETKSLKGIFKDKSVLASFLNISSLFLFVWSLAYVHNIVAVLIYGVWRIFLAILSHTSKSKYEFIKWALFFVAVLAFLLSILSNFFGDADFFQEGSRTVFNFEYIFGLILLLGSMILQKDFREKFMSAMHIVLKSSGEGENPEESPMVTKLLAQTIGHLMVVGVAVVALLIFESSNLFQGFTDEINIKGIILILISAPICGFLSRFFYHQGIKKTSQGDFDWTGYLVTLFSIAFLLIFNPLRNVFSSEASSSISGINWIWVIAGIVGLTSASIAINFTTEEKRFGITSLVGSLWVTGAFTLIRDDWTWWAEGIEPFEAGFIEYYGFVAATATVFALLISFEISRLENRTIEEEKTVFLILHKLRRYYQKENEIFDDLKNLDSSTNSLEVKSNYLKIIDKLEDDSPIHAPAGLESSPEVKKSSDISEIIAELNAFAYSKQYGRGSSELITIGLLAGLTIFISVVLRPASQDYGGIAAYFVDTFSFILPATFVYLIFHLVDLHQERSSSIMERGKVKISGNTLTYETHEETDVYEDPEGIGKWRIGDPELKNKKKRPVDLKDTLYRVAFLSTSTRETTSAFMLVTFLALSYFFLYYFKWFA